MDEIGLLLTDMVSRLLDAREGEADFRPGVDDAIAAARLEELGLTKAMIAEELGGSGLRPANLLPVLRVLGRFLAFVPTAERIFAHWLSSLTGAAVPFDAVAAHTTVEQTGERARGVADRVAWDDGIGTVGVAIGDADLMLLPVSASSWSVAVERTLAGERRATVAFDTPLVQGGRIAGLTGCGLLALGAAIRCQLMAGALARVLELTVRYVGERRQFGRSLGQFQAIQHQVALMAGEVAAAQAGADAAAEGFGMPPDVPAIAAGKVRCGEAAGKVAAIAHQLHGAMGYAAEHPLHRLTKQLWTWREEWGSESHWAGVLGRAVVARGDIWSSLAPLAEQAPVGEPVDA